MNHDSNSIHAKTKCFDVLKFMSHINHEYKRLGVERDQAIRDWPKGTGQKGPSQKGPKI